MESCTIANCANTGEIKGYGEMNAAGIAVGGSVKLSNVYNAGAITDGVALVSISSGSTTSNTFENVYYLSGCATNKAYSSVSGISADDIGTEKTAMNTAEFVTLLNTNRGTGNKEWKLPSSTDINKGFPIFK